MAESLTRNCAGSGHWGKDPLISLGSRDSRFENQAVNMSDLLWLTDAQMARLEPYFPKSHGEPRVDDRCVRSGNIFMIRNRMRLRNTVLIRPYTTAGSDRGVFGRIVVGLTAEHGERRAAIIDATYLNARWIATSLEVKMGGCPPD